MDKHDVIIVGAGISGLSTAHFIHKARPDLKLLLLEKSERPGGAVRTHETNGFLAEWGPHGFLDNIEESRELLADLNMGDQMQKAALKEFLRYICFRGQLQVIPQTPPAILKSNLLPLASKIRVLGDLIKKPLSGEPSVAEWAAYRFGKAILPFADIALTGTYAGDINRLSIDAAMPGLRLLENEYGSVFRGAIKSRKQKSERRMPSMISFKKGMEQLVGEMAAHRQILLQTALTGISKSDGSWRLETDQGVYKTGTLVMALHINQALPFLDTLRTAPKRSISEAIVYNIVMGFEKNVKIPFGFGYLAPELEKRFALGALFPTHMFPGRAPGGMNSLEVLVGGIRNQEHLKLSDDDLIEAAYADIRQLIKLPPRPLFAEVLRPETGIPQLEMGHHQLQSYRGEMESEFPGLYVNGFGWEGIGLNDMIKQAKHTAANLIRGRGGDAGPVSVKGVYF